jgi:hypothetical protein
MSNSEPGRKVRVGGVSPWADIAAARGRAGSDRTGGAMGGAAWARPSAASKNAR